MTKPDIVLFHSVLGLRPAVLEWAERLRTLGHTVHTPDLYDGEVFDDVAAGAAKRDSMGIAEFIRRTNEALASLPERLVYAGFSAGAAAAEQGLLQRPGALGAILMHGALPVAAFGAERWPDGIPAQVHYAVDDPDVDAQAIEQLATEVEAAAATFERFAYPGAQHRFADRDSPEYVEAHAEQMWERFVAFLEHLSTVAS
jgi:dienelactone hydrolase